MTTKCFICRRQTPSVFVFLLEASLADLFVCCRELELLFTVKDLCMFVSVVCKSLFTLAFLTQRVRVQARSSLR